MKILLIFPPVGDPTRPYLSLPQTKAMLNANGQKQVTQKDYNLSSYIYYLDRNRLERTQNHIMHRLEVLNQQDSLYFEAATEYARLLKSTLFMPYINKHIGNALEVLKTPALFAVEEDYLSAMSVFERALQGVSAEHFPTQWYSYAFRMRYSPESPVEIMQALEAEDTNPFLAFYREKVLSEIIDEKYRVVRIVVAYQNQIIPSLTLARLIKSHNPLIHINLGGVTASYHAQRLAAWSELTSLVDSITIDSPIPFEGECGGDYAFVELINRMERKQPWHDIPGVTVADSSTGSFVVNQPAQVKNMNRHVTPDFNGLPLQDYISPILVLPYALSRGCHWSRCAYCFHNGKYVTQNIDSIISDLKELSKKYDTRYFYFADDAVSPAMLGKLSERLLSEKMDILWHCMVRPEKQISIELAKKMAAAGCRSTFIGVESANQRMLKLINKGTTPETIRKIIRNLHQAGIAVRVFCMIGLPTETFDEASETLQLLLSERESIKDVRCQVFRVEKDTRMARFPKEYGIRNLHDDPLRPLAYELSAETESGMTQEEVIAFHRHFEKKCNQAFNRWNSQATFFGFSHSSHSLYRSCAEIKSAGRKRAICSDSVLLDRVPTVSGSVSIRQFPFNVESIWYSGSEKPGEGSEARSPLCDSIPKKVTTCLYVGKTNHIYPVSSAIHEVLKQCNGSARVSEIIDMYPEHTRNRLVNLIQDLNQREIITLS